VVVVVVAGSPGPGSGAGPGAANDVANDVAMIEGGACPGATSEPSPMPPRTSRAAASAADAEG
jgi:hypothetical protein